jgi:uncharacterized protein (DUF1330 family)
MADAKSYLVISALAKAGMQEKLHNYLSQAMPLAMAAGGKPTGRFMATEQLVGEGGPNIIATLEFADDQAIKGMVESAEFAGLAELRNEVFEHLDMIICKAM